MMAPRWLIVPFCASLAALGFAACKGAEATGGSSSSGGAGGSGETSTSAQSGTTSSGSSLPEAGPLTCKGMYTNIPTGSCDLLAQDCGPGRTCAPSHLLGQPWTTKCTDAPGIKSETEVCSSGSECRGGLHCVAGRCAPFCCPTSGQPCLGGVCGFTVQYDMNAGLYVRACRYSQQCEVLIPDACPTGYDCHIDDVMSGLATCGAPSSMLAGEYQKCQFSNDCGDMQQCRKVPAYPADFHCYTLCYTTGPKATNPKGLGGCDPIIDSCDYGGTLGLTDVGLCVPKNGLPDAGGGG